MPNIRILSTYPIKFEAGDTLITQAGSTLNYGYGPGDQSVGTLAVPSTTQFARGTWVISSGAFTDCLLVTGASAASAATTKQAMAVLATPTSAVGSFLKNAEMCFRYTFDFPAQPTWVRLRIRNWNLGTDAAVPTGANFTASYIGEQAVDVNGAPTAGFKTTPVQAFPAFTMDTIGTEFVSAKITDPAVLAVCTPGKRLLLSMAYTGGDTSTGQGTGYGEMFYANVGGDSARVAQVGTTNFGVIAQSIFDVRVEYGFVGNQKVHLILGDSICVDAGSGQGVPAYSRWPDVYNRIHKDNVILVNSGIGGFRSDQWGTLSKQCYQRLNPSEIAYDGAVIQVGINDVAQSATLAQMKTRFVANMAVLASLPTPITRIWALPLTPYNTTGYRAIIAADVQIGATTLTTRQTVPTGVVRIGSGSNVETMTIATATTGTGPYTVTLPSATTKFHPAGEQIAFGQQLVLNDWNAFLRTLPNGMVACGWSDRLIRWSVDPLLWDPEYTSDQLHPTTPGHQVYAGGVPRMT